MNSLLASLPKRLLFALLLTAALVAPAVAARHSPSVAAQPSPFHPTFPFLDASGRNVLQSGEPVSTIATCGACHDTAFIEEHSLHSSVGLGSLFDVGQAPEGRSWDLSPGLFGRWSPLAYRTLSAPGDEFFDLGTAEWVQVVGPRHAGGGPATTSRQGEPLTALEPAPGDPETHVLDPGTGEPVAWDWTESGVVEMNCFLCHTQSPNNEARVEALHAGEFKWANTATLQGTGLVERGSDSYRWSREGFDPEGNVKLEMIGIQDPSNENCGLCHGLVHDELEGPLSITGCVPERYRTVMTGQIISPQRLSDSGMNLANKDQLTRSWDIHAERLLTCTDCHYSLNNPVYIEESEASLPEHLTFDPRRPELGEYLYQPLHQFARGQSAQSRLAPEQQDTMRRCDSCHDVDAGHEWLPYRERHAQVLACETCHIPQLYTNALQSLDWTVLTLDSGPNNQCRGIEGDPDSLNALVTGFQPAVLPQRELDGEVRLAPFNLVTTWYWAQGDSGRPIRLRELEAAWLDEQGYQPEVLAAFDADEDGKLEKAELRIDTPEKHDLIRDRLVAQGVPDPRIEAQVQPYSINHGVGTDEWAVRDCRTCHSEDSLLGQSFTLASPPPIQGAPGFVTDANVLFGGSIERREDGSFAYTPSTQSEGIYILGHDAELWIDRLGGMLFLGTLVGITAHGGARALAGVLKRRKEPDSMEVYMYGVYERLWHWLQTFVIVALLLTGLIIHKPDTFAVMSFRGVVLVHNILAAILVINAGLALFYHLASGEIRQFLPRPVGFFGQAVVQARYYLRGIFRGEPHPFHKQPGRKLNPLQQVTYLAILNLLLPLQVLTGMLMWGVQQWPQVTGSLGGLPFLAPFHTLIAWLFASFIVLHVYLTTTGPAPLTNLRAMMLGWEPAEPKGV